jgi:hypothetical protein
MTLTTKPRPGQTHKKIKAAHHRHSKNYLKPYWPYLPISLIIGGGVVVNSYWVVPAAVTVPIHLVSYNYINLLETGLAALALSIFLLRHGFAWRRVWVYGEEFVTSHPVLDIALVFIATSGILLIAKSPAFT